MGDEDFDIFISSLGRQKARKKVYNSFYFYLWWNQNHKKEYSGVFLRFACMCISHFPAFFLSPFYRGKGKRKDASSKNCNVFLFRNQIQMKTSSIMKWNKITHFILIRFFSPKKSCMGTFNNFLKSFSLNKVVFRANVSKKHSWQQAVFRTRFTRTSTVGTYFIRAITRHKSKSQHRH